MNFTFRRNSKPKSGARRPLISKKLLRDSLVSRYGEQPWRLLRTETIIGLLVGIGVAISSVIVLLLGTWKAGTWNSSDDLAAAILADKTTLLTFALALAIPAERSVGNLLKESAAKTVNGALIGICFVLIVIGMGLLVNTASIWPLSEDDYKKLTPLAIEGIHRSAQVHLGLGISLPFLSIVSVFGQVGRKR
jgi:hypothetical protein